MLIELIIETMYLTLENVQANLISFENCGSKFLVLTLLKRTLILTMEYIIILRFSVFMKITCLLIQNWQGCRLVRSHNHV
jgi:hypothetical protein